MAALAFTLALCAACVGSVRLDAEAVIDQLQVNLQVNGSENPFEPACDYWAFMKIKFGWGGGGFITGGLRSEAKENCEKDFYGRGFSTETQFEKRWMQEACKTGVQIGHLLCGQDSAEGSGVAPLNFIDHWELPHWRGPAARSFLASVKQWCNQKPQPQWTGFEDCWHACQVKYLDCGQWEDRCALCRREGPEKSTTECHGIRHPLGGGSTSNDNYDVAPKPEYSFLKACQKGCKAYTDKKSKKQKEANGQSGPACRSEKLPVKMARTDFRLVHEKSCTESNGIMEGQSVKICYCDRAKGQECLSPQHGGKMSRSAPGNPAPGGRGNGGCMEDKRNRRSGFMEDCRGCRCG